MSISDLYSSGKHKQETGHFANIVKIAKADGNISEIELNLLIKVGKKLNITEEEFTLILNNPEKFPLNPPVDHNERIERLYRLAKMILVDGDAALTEVKLMQKVAVGLHFPTNNVELICNKAIELVTKDINIDDFTTIIKEIN